MRRIVPVVMSPQPQKRRRHKEGQLTRMLIIQVGAYLVFSTPAGVGYTLVTFVTSMNTTFMTQLRTMFTLWQQSIYFLSFFLYMLSSNAYRQQLDQMFKFNHFGNQLSHHIVSINANDNHVQIVANVENFVTQPI